MSCPRAMNIQYTLTLPVFLANSTGLLPLTPVRTTVHACNNEHGIHSLPNVHQQIMYGNIVAETIL